MIILWIILIAFLSNLIILPLIRSVYTLLAVLISIVTKQPFGEWYSIGGLFVGFSLIEFEIKIGRVVATSYSEILSWYMVLIMAIITLAWNIRLWQRVPDIKKNTIGGVLWGALIGTIIYFVRQLF